MNIFHYEFQMKRKSILLWSLSLVGFFIFYMAFFPTLVQDSQAFESIMDSFPEELLSAMGLNKDLSLASLIGYFSLTFTLIQLGLGIQSANYGFSILSEEERELTADFLMTKPVSRSRIFWSKFFAACLSLLITAVIVGVGGIISIGVFNGGEAYKLSHVLLLFASVPIFQLIFLSLGMVISLFFRKVRSVLSLSMGLVIGLYVVNSMKGILDSNLLGYFTPFHYFEPGDIMRDGTYNLSLLWISILIIGVSLFGSYILYKRRDIHSL